MDAKSRVRRALIPVLTTLAVCLSLLVVPVLLTLPTPQGAVKSTITTVPLNGVDAVARQTAPPTSDLADGAAPESAGANAALAALRTDGAKVKIEPASLTRSVSTRSALVPAVLTPT